MSKRIADYVIQKGVPMPDSLVGKHNKRIDTIYPFADMKLKDCFTFPKADRGKVQAAISGFCKGHPTYHFAIRTIDGDTLGCWRVKG